MRYLSADEQDDILGALKSSGDYMYDIEELVRNEEWTNWPGDDELLLNEEDTALLKNSLRVPARSDESVSDLLKRFVAEE